MDFTSPVVTDTHERLIVRFGARVEGWWQRLPGLVADLTARWELDVGEPVGRGNTGLVVRCRRADGSPAILKLTPDPLVGRGETFALRTWEPTGRAPQVLGHDHATGTLLMEAIGDGTPLALRDTDVALSDIAALIDTLHRSGEPVVSEGVGRSADRIDGIFELWIRRHGGDANVTRHVPVERLHRGHARAQSLASCVTAPVLLHGDLHPANVLDGGDGRGLVAIDPRPAVGDPPLDAIDWVFWRRAPDRWEPTSRELASALQVDADRLWGWCTAFAAMLATGVAARRAAEEDGTGRDDAAERIDALLAIAP